MNKTGRWIIGSLAVAIVAFVYGFQLQGHACTMAHILQAPFFNDTFVRDATNYWCYSFRAIVIAQGVVVVMLAAAVWAYYKRRVKDA
jgi:hypothetical protein